MSATRFPALRTRSVALVAALAITASACGGGSDTASTTTATTDTMAESTTDTSTASSDAMTDDTMTDGTMTDGTEAPGTETTAGPSGETMIDGATLWTSADGVASMEVDPTWTDGGPLGAVLGTWTTGDNRSNVVVVNAPGIDGGLQELIDATIDQLPQVGTFTVIDSGVRKGPNGSDIGYLEYNGEVASAAGVQMHFIQIISIANGHATAATFTTGDGEYASMIDGVLPYIETIQAL